MALISGFICLSGTTTMDRSRRFLTLASTIFSPHSRFHGSAMPV